MEDRRKTDRRGTACQSRNPLCMTFGFMFGMIVGALIHTEQSPLTVAMSILLGTIVFHYTFVRNFNFNELLKVIKKGS